MLASVDDATWVTLCADLAEEFPEFTRAEILDEVMRAGSAADRMGLDQPEHFRATATLARNNLRLLGRVDLPGQLGSSSQNPTGRAAD